MAQVYQLAPEVYCLPVGNLLANCYVIRDQDKALLIDPGDESNNIMAFLDSLKVTPQLILITHVHFDHLGAVYSLQKKYNIPVLIHPADEPMLKETSAWTDYLLDEYGGITASGYVQDRQSIPFGNKKITTLHTPGHSPGSVCFLLDKILFTGDLIFADGGYGRTDLWGGSYPTLKASITEKVLSLPDETMICPGHGPMSYVRDERIYHES